MASISGRKEKERERERGKKKTERSFIFFGQRQRLNEVLKSSVNTNARW